MIVDATQVAGTIPEGNMFQSFLGGYSLIDLGFITSIEDGRASVDTCRLNNGLRISYKDVELLYIGNSLGYVNTESTGGLCLLLKPTSNMYNTQDGKVPLSSVPYADSCVKAIPLSNGSDASVMCGFNANGSFYIRPCNSNPLYEVLFQENSCSLSCGGTSYSLDSGGVSQFFGNGLISELYKSDGSYLKFYYATDNKVYAADIFKQDGSVTTYKHAYKAMTPAEEDDPSSFNNYMWTDTYNAEGSFTRVLKNSNGDDITSATCDAQGNISYLVKDGSSTLCSVSISADGEINVSKCSSFKIGSVFEVKP